LPPARLQCCPARSRYAPALRVGAELRAGKQSNYGILIHEKRNNGNLLKGFLLSKNLFFCRLVFQSGLNMISL